MLGRPCWGGVPGRCCRAAFRAIAGAASSAVAARVSATVGGVASLALSGVASPVDFAGVSSSTVAEVCVITNELDCDCDGCFYDECCEELPDYFDCEEPEDFDRYCRLLSGVETSVALWWIILQPAYRWSVFGQAGPVMCHMTSLGRSLSYPEPGLVIRSTEGCILPDRMNRFIVFGQIGPEMSGVTSLGGLTLDRLQ